MSESRRAKSDPIARYSGREGKEIEVSWSDDLDTEITLIPCISGSSWVWYALELR